MELLKGLNKEQEQAVTYGQGPLLVLAGAGSGKTRVLTHRIAYLMEEKNVMPYEILAITFSNKAAAEMKHRIFSLVGPQKDLWIGTFHGICNRILRIHGEILGYNTDFTIYDTQDQKKVLKDTMASLKIDEKEISLNQVAYAISQAKNNQILPRDYCNHFGEGYKEKAIESIYEGYEKRLNTTNAMDFDDLLLKTVELLDKDAAVLEKFQQRFRYILVDEYQDTNRTQYLLVTKLAAKFRNLFVVGDDDQSIYGWRGADITNILDFEKDYPEATVIRLEQNYRSTQSILKAANHVIENNHGRKGKNLWTENDKGEVPKIVELETEIEEAKFIATEIGRLHDYEKCKPSDIAILYRTNVQSRAIEEMFGRYNIPYRVLGGLKFYSRKEIKDVLAYLKFLGNALDDVSLERIINTPKRGIGEATITKLKDYALLQNCSLFEAAKKAADIGLSKRASTVIIDFSIMMEGLLKRSETLSLEKLAYEILSATGYQRELENEKTVEAQNRLENIGELIGTMISYELEEEEPSLKDFLTRISLVADTDDLIDEDQKVTLMTIHSAKGLEYPVVFLCGLEEGLFPIRRSFDAVEDMEEERRLCYVGITRAEKKLYMTHATTRNIFGKKNYNMPSRFIKEMPQSEMIVKTKSTPSFAQQGVNDMATSKQGRMTFGFNPGDKVEHSKFGFGTVENYSEASGIVEVTFSSVGLKKLDLSFAPLKKINGAIE